jgi:hypothetical protein
MEFLDKWQVFKNARAMVFSKSGGRAIILDRVQGIRVQSGSVWIRVKARLEDEVAETW